MYFPQLLIKLLAISSVYSINSQSEQPLILQNHPRQPIRRINPPRGPPSFPPNHHPGPNHPVNFQQPISLVQKSTTLVFDGDFNAIAHGHRLPDFKAGCSHYFHERNIVVTCPTVQPCGSKCIAISLRGFEEDVDRAVIKVQQDKHLHIKTEMNDFPDLTYNPHAPIQDGDSKKLSKFEIGLILGICVFAVIIAMFVGWWLCLKTDPGKAAFRPDDNMGATPYNLLGEGHGEVGHSLPSTASTLPTEINAMVGGAPGEPGETNQVEGEITSGEDTNNDISVEISCS